MHNHNSSGEGFIAGMSMMMMLMIGGIALVLVVGALLWRPWDSGSTTVNNNPSQQQQAPNQPTSQPSQPTAQPSQPTAQPR